MTRPAYRYEHLFQVKTATRSRLYGRDFRVGQVLMAFGALEKDYVQIINDGRLDELRREDLEYLGPDLERLNLDDLVT